MRRIQLALCFVAALASARADAKNDGLVLTERDGPKLVELFSVEEPGCALAGVSIDRDVAVATIRCGDGRAAEVKLSHVSSAPPGAERTRNFALAFAPGADPALRAAVLARIRAREGSFAWSRATRDRPAGPGPTGASGPVAPAWLAPLGTQSGVRASFASLVALGVVVGAISARRDRAATERQR